MLRSDHNLIFYPVEYNWFWSNAKCVPFPFSHFLFYQLLLSMDRRIPEGRDRSVKQREREREREANVTNGLEPDLLWPKAKRSGRWGCREVTPLLAHTHTYTLSTMQKRTLSLCFLSSLWKWGEKRKEAEGNSIDEEAEWSITRRGRWWWQDGREKRPQTSWPFLFHPLILSLSLPLAEMSVCMFDALPSNDLVVLSCCRQEGRRNELLASSFWQRGRSERLFADLWFRHPVLMSSSCNETAATTPSSFTH